jgi:hypothetical protein
MTIRAKRAISGKRYGSLNRHVFSQIKQNPSDARKMLRQVKKRSKAARAGEFSMDIKFSPEVFLTNPIENVSKYLQMFLGANLSLAVRDRIVIDEKGPNGETMGPFFNTGGMWSGFDAKKSGSGVVAQFYKSTYSSNVVLGFLKQQPGLNLRELKAQFRKKRKESLVGTEAGLGKFKGWSANVRNRWKAWTVLEKATKHANFLRPSNAEHEAIMHYLEDLLKLRVMIGDVSNVKPSLRKSRAKRLVKALGKIRAPNIKIN